MAAAASISMAAAAATAVEVSIPTPTHNAATRKMVAILRTVPPLSSSGLAALGGGGGSLSRRSLSSGLSISSFPPRFRSAHRSSPSAIPMAISKPSSSSSSSASSPPPPPAAAAAAAASQAAPAETEIGTKTKLQQLFQLEGQSPWLDNLSRGFIADGGLKDWIDKGVRGVTSNPTIFQKSISGTSDYDDQFAQLIQNGSTAESAYWSLVVKDIQDALDVFRPLYVESGGEDGFVSVEVAPSLAHDTQGTVENARLLHKAVDRPNVYIKIPATKAGIPAISQVISEGISVNVTLIFSIERYEEVFDAYVAGLEAYKGDDDLSKLSSVASFFVSRVDSEVDKRLDAIGTPEALSLRGKTAVAQAQLAYDLFKKKCAEPRWQALAARGARVQRPLWASTGVKNEAYPDTLYVDTLIGPHTVNTLPDATLKAFYDHGAIKRTIDADVAGAQAVIQAVERVGISLAEVADQLEREGVASFAKSFDDLMAALTAKGVLLKP
ncbi:hypothetical protein CBR_g51451 [Chara braunii]|uniref:Transaldolase n=1 Tax=Chara braunii TaxID=69332 RepID=A0A388K6B0_CHABU|nr:hypothetical protein CBR_g51451 [Chara braunii]|eukprot:GBG65569.1 hypothetical protein CBR_g51451 [Chara braunii]